MPHDLKLKNLRLSFPTLGVPEYYQNKKQRENDERRWTATFLVPVNDPQFKLVNDTIEAIAKETFEKKWQQVLAAIEGNAQKFCWIDGKKKAYEGYQGAWALSSLRKESAGRPGVFDTDKTPIYKPDGSLYEGKAMRVYAGCYVNAHVNFWPQDNTHGQAVRCELVAIQRSKDGDAFSGGMAVDDSAFEEISEGADADDLA